MKINSYIIELIKCLEKTEISSGNLKKYNDYENGIDILIERFSNHKKDLSPIYFIGNGGSSAIASHMIVDFMKNGGMNTCSLYDNSFMTCMGNDFGYEYIFSRPLGFLIRERDLLVAISSSGESKNIINAIKIAKQMKAEVITFTGFNEKNKVRQLGDLNVYVPCKKYGIVESIHNLILQQIADYIMERDGVHF